MLMMLPGGVDQAGAGAVSQSRLAVKAVRMPGFQHVLQLLDQFTLKSWAVTGWGELDCAMGIPDAMR